MCICSPTSSLGPMVKGNVLNSMAPQIQQPYSIFEQDENNPITIREDETCFMLSIEMPNVHESDLQVSLRKNILTISGYRRSASYASDSDSSEDGRICIGPTKRQRLSRQLQIDPTAIDVERAMASIYNGCYTLYAPKRRRYIGCKIQT